MPSSGVGGTTYPLDVLSELRVASVVTEVTVNAGSGLDSTPGAPGSAESDHVADDDACPDEDVILATNQAQPLRLITRRRDDG